MPSWLRDAHATLDHAVLSAYGWPQDITDEVLLARLLALNLERAVDNGRARVTERTLRDRRRERRDADVD